MTISFSACDHNYYLCVYCYLTNEGEMKSIRCYAVTIYIKINTHLIDELGNDCHPVMCTG